MKKNPHASQFPHQQVMTMQDHATLKEIKDLAKNITQKYGIVLVCRKKAQRDCSRWWRYVADRHP